MIKSEDVEKIALSAKEMELAEVAARLGEEIADQFEPRDERPMSIVARNVSGELIGGLNGVSHWRWLYIRHLWIEPAQRGRGLGSRLMAEAERLARGRGCVGVYVDTFEPRAGAFYEALGFTRAGEIVGFPPGHARLFFQKSLQ